MPGLQGFTIDVSRVSEIQTLPVQEVYEALATSPEGLSSAEATARLERFGRNAIAEAKRTSLVVKFAANFTHLMAILLWVGGIVGFIAKLPELGIAVWMVNLINGVFSFWQEFKAEKATEALRRMLPAYVLVLRDGQEQRLLAEELVPGDVMLLAEGDHISADARLVDEAELRADQSTLTGESHPVRKTAEAVLRNGLSRAEISNLVFAGTSAAAGTGRAVVFATGMGTEFGKIAHLTQSVGEEPSPLQIEMKRATKAVSVIAVAVGAVFFTLAIVLAGVNLAESFIFALGMIVAFVPEGMLPTVTLALAMGVQRMAKRHALIKKLSAVETLGGTTVICTDKTGTLTQNQMTVQGIWVSDRLLTVTGGGYAPEGQVLDGETPPTGTLESDLRQVITAAGLCNNSRLLPPTEETRRWTILGDPTEAALRVVAPKVGLELRALAEREPRVRELPFESRRKRMSTIHRLDGHAARSSGRVAYVKGAPREILALCGNVLLNGRASPLDDHLRARIVAANDNYARSGLRVLAVAMRSLPDGFSDYRPEAVEQEMTFLGLMAMMDPPRPEVAEAVRRCRSAGIRIIMITGDYGLTAESIARRIGMIHGDQPRLVNGADMDNMSDDELQEALNEEVIFARVAPENKMRVVSALQDKGHVVAVTGDGVNDAPALKKADIGVAMGIAGTDVAKEAANMILTDDNFASIVNAVEEGRAVYANIKKFITYIFTSNMPEAFPFVFFVFSAGRIPLGMTIMQILAVDLGTDMVPALALGAEPPEAGIMDRPPRSLKEHIIDRALLLRAYGYLGMIQGAIAMIAFYFVYWVNGYWGKWIDLPDSGYLYRAATAMTLGSVVATQIGNLFAQRSVNSSVFRMRLFNNRLIWVGIAVELTLVFVLTYVPFFHGIFNTAALPLWYWLFLFAWIPSLALADEARKAIVRWRQRRAGGR